MMGGGDCSAAEVTRREDCCEQSWKSVNTVGEKVFFPEQITDWRKAFIASSSKQSSVKNVNASQSRDDKIRICELERELRRKDAALAETVALLVLRKKLNDYWGSDVEVRWKPSWRTDALRRTGRYRATHSASLSDKAS
jgi:hypothetical protein